MGMKVFEDPKVEVIYIEVEDVITASTKPDPGTGGLPPL